MSNNNNNDNTIFQSPIINNGKNYEMVTNSGNKFTMEPTFTLNNNTRSYINNLQTKNKKLEARIQSLSDNAIKCKKEYDTLHSMVVQLQNERYNKDPSINTPVQHHTPNNTTTNTFTLRLNKSNNKSVDNPQNTKNNIITSSPSIPPPLPSDVDDDDDDDKDDDNLVITTFSTNIPVLILYETILVPGTVVTGASNDQNNTAIVLLSNTICEYPYQYIYIFDGRYVNHQISNVPSENLKPFHPTIHDEFLNNLNDDYDVNPKPIRIIKQHFDNKLNDDNNTLHINTNLDTIDPKSNTIWTYWNKNYKLTLVHIPSNKEIIPLKAAIILHEYKNVNIYKVQFLRSGNQRLVEKSQLIDWDRNIIDKIYDSDNNTYYTFDEEEEQKKNINIIKKQKTKKERKKYKPNLNNKKTDIWNAKRIKLNNMINNKLLPLDPCTITVPNLKHKKMIEFNKIYQSYTMLYPYIIEQFNNHIIKYNKSLIQLKVFRLNQLELDELFNNKILTMEDVQFYNDIGTHVKKLFDLEMKLDTFYFDDNDSIPDIPKKHKKKKKKKRIHNKNKENKVNKKQNNTKKPNINNSPLQRRKHPHRKHPRRGSPPKRPNICIYNPINKKDNKSNIFKPLTNSNIFQHNKNNININAILPNGLPPLKSDSDSDSNSNNSNTTSSHSPSNEEKFDELHDNTPKYNPSAHSYNFNVNNDDLIDNNVTLPDPVYNEPNYHFGVDDIWNLFKINATEPLSKRTYSLLNYEYKTDVNIYFMVIINQKYI